MSGGSGRAAVVLLSGGMDSATVLAYARREGVAVHALSIDYGQRHRSELEAARRIVEHLGAEEHRVVRVDLRAIGGSALTDETMAVPTAPTVGIPPTYVPARNTVFLALALGWAETLDLRDLYIGANVLDYSGYPDCRPEYLRAFEALAQLATRAGVEEGARFRIHAPLLTLSKAEIVRLGSSLGVDYGLTVSCYRADEEGRACGLCDSCRLRRKGFLEAGLPDPTRYLVASS
jgi:7-cyano-7-deazaguanine synthase